MAVHVRVPATSANLGPGFDALGLALDLDNEVQASEDDRISVSIEGEGVRRLPTSADNVVARGVRLAFQAAGRPFRGVALRCVNRIPPARGLGSSSAAWVGGLMAGNQLMGGPLSREKLLELAAGAEGHPDNVAAALYGALTVSCTGADGRVLALSLPVPDSLSWVVLVPSITSSTAEARAVLPASVSRGDAVFNVQRVALLLAALHTARDDALPTALDDKLHQPYRRALFPWLPAVAEAARAAGALGCVLSGAGPSLLAVVHGQDRADTAVAPAMEKALRAAGIEGRAKRYGVAPGAGPLGGSR
jgi:homoserine kinase